MPSASFHHRAHSPAPVQDAWTALQAPETWSALAGVDDVTDVVHADGVLESFEFTVSVAGTQYQGRAETERSDPPTAMAVRISGSELEGTIEALLEPNDDGTALDVHLTLASKSLIAAMFFPVISAVVGNGLADQVEDLAGRIAVSDG